MSDTQTVTRGRWSTITSAVRTRFRLVHLAPVLAVIALGAWIFASPIGAAPDDDFHLTSTWCANELRTDLCEPGPSSAERTVPPVVLHAACFAYDANESGACLRPLLEQPFEPTEVTARGSFEANYPPVYYAFMNLFASDDLLTSALVMRFINVLLLVGITTAMYALLPVARRASLLFGWIVTMVPLGLFLVASNNPSSWAIIGVGTSWLALVGYFETTGRRRIALGALFGLTVLMASGARGDSALYSILGMVVAVVLTLRREQITWRLTILPAVAAAVAIAFFFMSRQSTVAVSGLSDPTLDELPLSGFALIVYNLLNVPELWAGVFGYWPLGWLDTGLPPVVGIAGVGVFAAIIFMGIGRGTRSWRKQGAFLGLVAVLWLLPTYVLQQGGNAVGANVQPRYILPIMIILAGVAVFAVGAKRLRLTVVQTTIVVVTLSLAQAFALHTNIRRYVTGIEFQGANLDDSYEWWWTGLPLSPMQLWAVGSLAFAALVFVLLRDLRRAHHDISS